jgi:hypothetical protein
MAWVTVGIAGGTALLGALSAANQRKAQQQQNQAQADISAAQTQYSPWTGVKPQAAQMQAVTGDPLGGAAQGALSGAMFAQGMKNQDANRPKVNPEQDAMEKMKQEQMKNSFSNSGMQMPNSILNR